MWIKHKDRGVWNVSENTAKAMIKAGDAFACDKQGNPVGKSVSKSAPKVGAKSVASTKKKE